MKDDPYENIESVWVFNGKKHIFPSAVFSSRENAEVWINKHKIEGTLTKYPIDISVYDFCVSKELFFPKLEKHKITEFMGNFTSAAQDHYHYEFSITEDSEDSE